MWTIIDATTGKVLFAKFDNEVLEGQVAIEVILTETMDNPHWDFENEIFYDRND